MGDKPTPDTVGRFIHCPNCVPDYLNGFLDKPPILTDGHGCYKCGLGWDRKDRQKAVDLFANMLHQHMDHVTDWLAMFLADAGPQAIIDAKALADQWKAVDASKNWNAISNLQHTVVLALYARYCQWEKKAWAMCLEEAGQ